MEVKRKRTKAGPQALLREIGIEPANPDQVEAFRVGFDSRFMAKVFRGVVGSGKSGVAVWTAVARLAAGEFMSLAYTRPPVPKGPSLGSIPGEIGIKFGPYLRGWYDNAELVEPLLKRLPDKAKIEFPPLEYIKGATFRNTALIVDEAQDLTEDEAEAILGRCGAGSEIWVCGDVSQIDRKGNTAAHNGLSHIAKLVGLEPDVALVELLQAERGRGAELALILANIRRSA